MVAEECNPYIGKDSTCSEKSCSRTFVAKYRYVGGFYGACNEESMKLSLVQSGPMSVSFEVYPDFMHYSSGVYHHSGLLDKFNPFEVSCSLFHTLLFLSLRARTSSLIIVMKFYDRLPQCYCLCSISYD